MNGFNPLQGLKSSHIWVTLILAGCGMIGIVTFIVKGIIWLFNHIQII